MSSERKIEANRANAQMSRGPKTPHGRVRSAKNAFRHGLSLPVVLHPAWSQQVKILSDKIAGPGAKAAIRKAADQIAEAEVDLQRVRCARHQLLLGLLNDPNYSPRTEALRIPVIRHLLNPGRLKLPSAFVDQVLSMKPKGPFKAGLIIAYQNYQLLALDRYEQRARSRRKSAIRAWEVVLQSADGTENSTASRG